MSQVPGPKPRYRSWWIFLLDKVNVTVPALMATYLVWTRSVEVAYFGAGLVVCGLSAKLLKRIIRQPRPDQASQRKVTYGMPSTHSAAIACFATYVPLACLYLPSGSFITAGALWRTLPPLIVIPSAILVASSRVWLGYHTWPQVAVGSAYGVVFATLWFNLWTSGVDRHANLLENTLRAQKILF